MKYVKIELIGNNKDLELITKTLLDKKLTNKTNIIKIDSYYLKNNKLIKENNYILSFITRYKSIIEIKKLIDNKNIELLITEVSINDNYKKEFEDSTNTPVFL